MSTDFSIRPVGAPAPTPLVQPQTQAAAAGVATELPASKSVTAADAGAAVQNDPHSLTDLTYQAYFDRNAASMVYEIVNRTNNQVIEQTPDEAILRRLAYFRWLDQQRKLQPPVIPTDRKA